MKIFSGNNPTEAHIVCQLLQSEGIHAEVRGEGLFGLKGELPMTEDTDPYVWLLDNKQHNVATRIVAEYRNQNQYPQEVWRCLNCGEDNDGHFGACWKCGSAAPAMNH